MPALPTRLLVVATTSLALTGGIAFAATGIADLGADTEQSAWTVPAENPSIPAPTSADPLTVPKDPKPKKARAKPSEKPSATASAQSRRARSGGDQRPATGSIAATQPQQGYRAAPPAPAPGPGYAEPPAPAPPPSGTSAVPVSFVISSFNVLGSSHTAGRDPRPAGTVRIARAAQLLTMHGVDVAGLQELQSDQYSALMRIAGGTYDTYPGLTAGRLGVENSIIWRKSEWQLQQALTIPIPYFSGRIRPMPYVLLRHASTGRMIWVANFHNPATNRKRGNNDRWRDQAAALETQLAARLWNESGYPVFVVGDMNDRERYFCRITAGAPMQAANGGSNVGGCRPPRHPMPVDWIFGSNVVRFSNYVRDMGPLVRSTTDHPMIRATATLDGSDGLPR